jgi:hypothetical protein
MSLSDCDVVATILQHARKDIMDEDAWNFTKVAKVRAIMMGCKMLENNS